MSSINMTSATPMKRTLWGQELTDLQLDPETFPTDAEIKEIDDICGGDLHGWYKSEATGKMMHYRKFLPDTDKPRGILVCLHGVHGNSGQAFRLKEEDGTERCTSIGIISRKLCKAGFVVYAPDFMGHGFSEGERFYIPKWEYHRDDTMQMCRLAVDEHDGVPFFLMGQSYGGALTLHAMRSWQDHPETLPKGFKGFIAVCPAIEGKLPPLPVVWTLRYGLAPIFPTWIPSFMPHPVSPDRIWTDKRVSEMATSERMTSMGLSAGGRPYCLGTAVALLTTLEEVRSKAIPGLNFPFCAVHGTDDVAVPISGSEYLLKHCATPEKDRKLLRIEGAKHDIFSEPNAEEIMDQVVDWIESRMK